MVIEHPDWLPLGWKITVKARPSGKKDKYYVHPSTGRKFKSRPDVLNFLKRSKEVVKANAKSTVPKAKRTAPKTKSTVRKIKTTVKIKKKKPVALELPPGWIKKVRTTTPGNRTRRDATYFDLSSGHRCRSLVEVFRYIESKEVKKAKAELDATKSRNYPEASEAKAKELKVNDKRADENIIRYERVRSGRKLAGGLKVAPTKNKDMPKDDTCSEQSGEEVCLAVEFSDKLRKVTTKNKDMPKDDTCSEQSGEEVCLAVEFSDKLRKVKRRAHKLRDIKELSENIVAKIAGKDQTPGATVVDNDRTPRAKIVGKDQTPKSGAVTDNIAAKVAEKDQTPRTQVTDKYQTPKSEAVNDKEPCTYRRKSKRLAEMKLEDNVTKKRLLQSDSKGSVENNTNNPLIEGLERQNKKESSKKPLIGGSERQNKEESFKKPVIGEFKGQNKNESSSKPVIGSLEGQNEKESFKKPEIGSSEGQNKKESFKKSVIEGFEGQNKKESSSKPVIGFSEGQNKKENSKKPVIGGTEGESKKEHSKKHVIGGWEGQNKKESPKKPVIGGSEGQDKTESSKKLMTEGLEAESKREGSKRKWMGNFPRRTSQRLACMVADPSLEENMGNKAGGNCKEDVSNIKCASKAGPSSEAEIIISESNFLKELPPKCRMDNPSDSSVSNHQKKVVTPGEQKSAGSEHKGNDTPEKHHESSLANLLMDPCIEFAIKTLTGVIPLEDVSKVSNGPASSLALPNQASASSSVLPSATVNIWGDPCFEFAVKTLMGESPMPKPTTKVQITFQQPFVGAPPVPKLASDNLWTLKQ